MEASHLAHLALPFLGSVDFQSRRGRGHDIPLPERDQQTHARRLLERVDLLAAELQATPPTTRAPEAEGHLVAADAAEGAELAVGSLGDRRTAAAVVATLPGGALVHLREDDVRPLRRKIEMYGDTDRNTAAGAPRNNRLVAPLEDVRIAGLSDVSRGWLTEASVELRLTYPVEFWVAGGRLASDDDRARVRRELEWLLERHGVPPSAIRSFAATERDILFARVPGALLLEVAQAVPEVYRLAQPSRAVIDLLAADLADFPLPSTPVAGPDQNAPVVAIIDTGVAEDHPLLREAIVAPGRSVVPGDLSAADARGHGTRMAGVAAYRNLGEELLLLPALKARAGILNVRMLPILQSDFEFLPERTSAACEEVDDALSERRRIYNLSLGAPHPDPESPTAWSTAVDLLSYAEGSGRLICVAAGNVRQPLRGTDYPSLNLVSGLTDPAQAVNALTVGAATWKTTLPAVDLGQGLAPLAGAGRLAPISRCSLMTNAPIKPEVVFEGGNFAVDGADNAAPRGSLSVVTTSPQYAVGPPLTTTGATSAACAGVSGLAAELWAANQGRWPQTIRGMIVHAARWTDEMVSQFPDRGERARAVGYGVPSVERVMYSTPRRPTLLSEQTFRTATRQDSSGRAVRELHMFQLPLSATQLERFGDQPVELSVTLSYFAEPNESSLSRYLGVGLRWDLQRPLETVDDFRRRINEIDRTGDEGGTVSDVPWEIGTVARRRGTVQSDRCRLSAAALAGDRLVAVWPIHGWWKDRAERAEAEVRYSLLVTIDVGDVDVDLYALIATQVPISV